MSASKEQWAAAQAAYESGAMTVSEIARHLDVTHQAASKHARRWTAPDAAAQATIAALPPIPITTPRTSTPTAPPASTEDRPQAPVGLDTPWGQMADREASAAGLMAAALRQRLLLELRDNPWRDPDTGQVHRRPGDYRMVRALSQSYKVFVEGAQLMIGGQTENIAVSITEEDRTARIATFLATLRDRRAAAIETTGEDGSDDDDG